ncbi:MAG TPA: hypothetical protein VFU96_02265 [Acidimicrobiia bacterium]|nr:hypothetical protein [Acidimicrobiia bacterium]
MADDRTEPVVIDVLGISPGQPQEEDAYNAITAAVTIAGEYAPLYLVVDGKRHYVDRVIVTYEPDPAFGAEGMRNVIEIHGKEGGWTTRP